MRRPWTNKRGCMLEVFELSTSDVRHASSHFWINNVWRSTYTLHCCIVNIWLLFDMQSGKQNTFEHWKHTSDNKQTQIRQLKTYTRTKTKPEFGYWQHTSGTQNTNLKIGNTQIRKWTNHTRTKPRTSEHNKNNIRQIQITIAHTRSNIRNKQLSKQHTHVRK